MSDNPYQPGWDDGYAAGVRATRRFLTTMSEVEGSANPYVLPVNRMGASADVAWDEGFAAGRAAATPDGWTPTSDAPDAPGWECELCGGKLDGPGEKCGSAQHGPAGSVVYGRAVPAGSLDVGDEPDERFAPPGDADRVTHGLVPPSVDLRDEDAIRRDERERLSARVYENGWCPTCAHKVDPNARPFLEGDALAAAILVDPAEVLSPEELAEYERCQQSVMDARRSAPMVEGQMIVGAAASPDERLREAEAALEVAAQLMRDIPDAAICEGGWHNRAFGWLAAHDRRLAAADREENTDG